MCCDIEFRRLQSFQKTLAKYEKDTCVSQGFLRRQSMSSRECFSKVWGLKKSPFYRFNCIAMTIMVREAYSRILRTKELHKITKKWVSMNGHFGSAAT